jgi:SAM-dependent methyltransferase
MGAEVDLHVGDLRALPVDGPFDAVVCWFTSFGYFSDEDNRTVLEEFHRVLRPGGTLVIETLSHDGFVREFTEAPELVVTEFGQDLMIDRSQFDVENGCVVTHRTTIRGGSRRDARYFIRLLTIPEWRAWLGTAGFSNVTFSDRDGDAVDLGTWRIVVRATA